MSLLRQKNPKGYLGTLCKVTALIKIEGIFICSSNESIQVKLCGVEILKENIESSSLYIDIFDKSESSDS